MDGSVNILVHMKAIFSLQQNRYDYEVQEKGKIQEFCI